MFNEGITQNMEQILAHREKRARKQQELLTSFNTKQLVVLTLNIPGPIKNNSWLSHLFHISVEDMKKVIQQYWWITHSEEINEASGMDYFVVVTALIEELKKKWLNLKKHILLVV